MKDKELSIIIVSYNTKGLLRDCLNSIIDNTGDGVDYEIIVADNASSDGSVEMLQSEFSRVRVIANKDNIGYAKANNQGIKVAKGETILFLNPDVIVLNNSISKMLIFVKSREDIGLIGPKLYININKEYHPSIRIFSKPIYTFLSYLPFAGTVINIYNSYFMSKDKVQKVDWMWGAALMVRRKVLNRIGFFDEKYFMYSEEEDLCYRAYKKGYKNYYFPNAQIVHLKGKSSETNYTSSTKYLWESKMYYFKKYSSIFEVKMFRIYFPVLLRLKAFLYLIPKNACKMISEVVKNA